MTRRDFQRLAERRLTDATVLLRNRRYDAAYYLAGYAVECAFKACIAKRMRRNVFPPKDLQQNLYIHNLDKLRDLAMLKPIFDKESNTDPVFMVKWGVVKDWSEDSRYRVIRRTKANEMVAAVADPSCGVLRCIKEHW